jgi:ABC-type phosphate transport system permease subunit
MSIPQTESALMFSALVLLVIVLAFNFAARLFLTRLERRIQ